MNEIEKINKLNQALESFNIKVDKIILKESECIDTYLLNMRLGTKFSSLEKILPDLGLHLKSQTVPRGYPVLADGIYKIEVQNKPLHFTKYQELLKEENNYYSPIILGTDYNNKPFIIDLYELPNLLLAGMPGSGKSILLHSIILSLIKNDAILYLLDPKLVEFNFYNGVKNIKEIGNSIEENLNIVLEVQRLMNERFQILSSAQTRNVLEYNKSRPANKQLKPIVLVIDEWADIVIQSKKIQNELCLVAQKGRAAGISVVLSTQRPSSEIITGIIKANFSGRIALRTASSLESRIILDHSGAEKIKNLAEGLYLDHTVSAPVIFKSPYLAEPKKFLNNKEEFKSHFSFWKRLWN